MKRYVLVVFLFIVMVYPAFAGQRIPNYKSWPRYPEVPRIEASLVANLLASGEKMLIFYAGFANSKEIICGSRFIGNHQVPPAGDGSTVNLEGIPKDTLMIVY